LCYDLVLGGYTDWYLTSIDELEKLYLNRTIIDGFGGTTNNDYWSSSEIDNNLAWAHYFNYEYEGQMYKSNEWSVRAVPCCLVIIM
jgi:hypothetical protein